VSRPSYRLSSASVLVVAALAFAWPTTVRAHATAGTETAAPLAETAALRAAVTVDEMVRHLEAFQAIADAHGGTRTAGSAGYDASADYVAGQLREAGYTVRFEPFTFPSFEEARPPRLLVLAEMGPEDSEGLTARTFEFSAGGTVEAQIWPTGAGTSDSGGRAARGCEASDFDGIPSGAIALVRRGTCGLAAKVENAAAAGAGAIVVYNRGDGDEAAFRGYLPAPVTIPAVSLSHSAGMRLAGAARQERILARLSVEASTSFLPTNNLIAETAVGDPESVILVGAHLDSVQAGPGINDNASGVAAILEIARQIARLGIETPNRLRFAFWGAEEDGLLGSEHHVASLPPGELERIVAVLNFDMLASANYGRFVYDGDGSSSDEGGPPGSAWIEQIFRAYFKAADLSVAEIDFEDGSDHLSFAEQGVPVGGLVAGDGERKSSREARLFGGTAGAPYDPCFHEACDTLEAINRTALDELTDAAAHAVLVLGSADRGELTGAP
jgi:Zn-dependent M28 family amino/carboxypeptidase